MPKRGCRQFSLLLLIVSSFVTGCENSVETPIPAGLLALSEEDRLAVMGQGHCPVDGKLLGESAAPLPATLKGTRIFVCSDACKSEAEKSPAKYLSSAQE